jgi:hypothetical protein
MAQQTVSSFAPGQQFDSVKNLGDRDGGDEKIAGQTMSTNPRENGRGR